MLQWPKRAAVPGDGDQPAPRDLNDLSGQVAVITGSTSGLGLALAAAVPAPGGHGVMNGLGDPSEIERTRAGIELRGAVYRKAGAGRFQRHDANAATGRGADGGGDRPRHHNRRIGPEGIAEIRPLRLGNDHLHRLAVGHERAADGRLVHLHRRAGNAVHVAEGGGHGAGLGARGAALANRQPGGQRRLVGRGLGANLGAFPHRDVDGEADIVASARQTLADPDWFVKIRSGRGAEIRRCEFTNYCEALDQQHKQVTCKLWDRDALDAPDVTLAADGKRRLVAPRWRA